MARASLLLRVSAEALLRHVLYCRSVRGLGLRCLDPPLVAAPLLAALGVSGYQARRFWAEAREASAGGDCGRCLVVYRWEDTVWRLRPLFGHERVFYDVEASVPVDEEDCRRLPRGRCGVVPRSNVFRVYLEGVHGGDMVRLNIVYVAALADEASGGEAAEALEAALGLLRGGGGGVGGALRVLGVAARLVSSAGRALGLILPMVPGSVEELFRVSPASRRLAQLLGALPGKE